MRYIDDFKVIDKRLGDELRYLNGMVGNDAIKEAQRKNHKSDMNETNKLLRKFIQTFLKIGLIKKTENEMYYEVGDETIAVPIYANCLASEMRMKGKQQEKIRTLIQKNVTLEEVKKERSYVLQSGVEHQDFTLACQLSAVIRKAFKDEALMEEIMTIFQTFFRNVYKDFQYTLNLDFIQYHSCLQCADDYTVNERISFLFFAHRLAKDISVYIWTIIFPTIAILKPAKKHTRLSVDDDDFDAFNEFAANIGVIPSKYMSSHHLDGKIEQIMRDFFVEEEERDIFVHACYYIASLEQDFMKYLDQKLDHCMQQEEVVEESDSGSNDLKLENKRLQEQIQALQGKCESLQETINNLVIEHRVASNKQQKEYEQLEKKYEECMEELKLYQELEQEEELSTEQVPQVDLKEKKIVIIGGHDRWHQLIKSIYPNWILINDEKPLDFNMFRVDGIFFFTKYMSHCLYRKYVNQCRSHDIPFSYLTSLNIKAVEEQIREALLAA